jgi:[acyl-carrier-protein] S-malonyltransferase
MPKIACIFPGQGSQYIGMGQDIYEAYPAARDVFRSANDALGFDLAGVCFNGPEEKLRETRYTQPAILVHSVAVWRIIEDGGFKPDFVAGHSVGEYSALVACGAVAYEDALRLVRDRAEAMYSAGIEKPGAMAALIGLPEGNLEALLEQAGQSGIIAAANFNSPVQIVVSGEVAAVERAIDIARNYGAKRAVRLNVSGAFHSPLMEMAEVRLCSSLRATAFSNPTIPLVSNVAAESVTEAQSIVSLLERQLTSPVLWYQSMRYLAQNEVTSVVEAGPGDVLCGLLKRIDSEIDCVSCSDISSIERFLEGVIA